MQVHQLLAEVQNALQRNDQLLSVLQDISSSRENNPQSEQLANVRSGLQRQHRLLADLHIPPLSSEDNAPLQSEHRTLTGAAGT